MHEIGLCEGLLELVEQQAAGRPVSRVRLRVGVRHAVVDDAFAQAFAMAAAGTVAADAEVELVAVPVRLRCQDCGDGSQSLDPLSGCPACGGSAVEVTGGDELTLESIVCVGTPEGVGADVSGHPG